MFKTILYHKLDLIIREQVLKGNEVSSPHKFKFCDLEKTFNIFTYTQISNVKKKKSGTYLSHKKLNWHK